MKVLSIGDFYLCVPVSYEARVDPGAVSDFPHAAAGWNNVPTNAALNENGTYSHADLDKLQSWRLSVGKYSFPNYLF